jgi:Bacterial PH domain
MRDGALVTVRGAELVDGRIVWGNGPRPGGAVGVWSRVWRRVGPGAKPLRLVEGERFVLATRLHWCVPCRKSWGMVVMWPAVFVVNTVMGFLSSGVWVLTGLMLLWATCHSMMVCHRWLSWRLDLLVVTSRRLLQVQGVFTHTVKQTMLHQVRRVEYHQSFWGAVFGFGWLRLELDGVHDVGSEREFIHFVPNVAEVFNEAQVFMTKLEA